MIIFCLNHLIKKSWQPPWIISPYLGALRHGNCHLKFYPFSGWGVKLGKNKLLNVRFWLITNYKLTLEEKGIEFFYLVAFFWV